MLIRTRSIVHSSRRLLSSFLDQNFFSSHIYDSRKNSPCFDSLSATDHGLNLIKNANKGKADILAYDIFANKTDELDENSLEFVETVINTFNKTQEATKISDSANHAFAKYFLKLNREENLLEIAKNKMKTGFFFDFVTCSLTTEKFLNQNHIPKAVQCIYESHLQQCFEHESSSRTLENLLLKTALEYFKLDQIPVEEEPLNKVESKDEEYVRVAYVRNPNYDNYLDVKDHKIMLGRMLKIVMSKYQIFPIKFVDFFCLLLEDNFKEAIEFNAESLEFSSHTKEVLTKLVSSTKCVENEEDNKPGMQRHPTITEKDQVESLIVKVKSGDFDLLTSLQKQIEAFLKDPEYLTEEGRKAQDLYSQYNRIREEIYEGNVKLKEKSSKILKAEEMLSDLLETEEYVTYFDNMDKIELNAWLAPRSRRERKMSKLKVYRSNIERYQRKDQIREE